MLIKKLSLAAIAFLILLGHQSCNSQKKSKRIPTPALYDLNNPVVFNLPDGLREISGIAYYPKDSSVFAIIDEAGIFYKIFLNGSGIIKKWTFDKRRDFEDVVRKDSAFYLLVSNGDVEILKFSGDSILTDKTRLGEGSKKVNEFESLYYDDSLGIVLMCKDCEDDKKDRISTLIFSPDSMSYKPGYAIDVKQISDLSGEKKLHFKPSAAAIHPQTKDLYIIASINHLLVIAGRNGEVKEVYPLDTKIYKQPEGITFTPWGDLLISNEAGESGNPNILILKPKKKG
ncbi:MAG TPA: SdiA-regulated domain-containing protein [Chitinophagaceae bacterium]|nr:SdiA-regulated domain-containing protein [Chitinophagaceae bacterium]